ncbi:MAG: beta-N-acetylhexosaminidase [Verrucomicrobiota bacterium]
MKFPLVKILLCLFTTTALATAAPPAIIPLPQKMEMGSGAFSLDKTTRVCADAASLGTGNYLVQQLEKGTGYKLKLNTETAVANLIPGGILLTTQNASTNLGAEGYQLTVASNSVVIRAATQAGLFYGVQSLLQLLPPEVFAASPQSKVIWQIPCVQIQDWPRFQWRGLMLDVSRHFFTKAEVKTVLDEMALHKLNTFHWHLTDDHGWRIEIKKHPKLTQIGAWRSGVGFDFPTNVTTAYGPDGRYGGFYTQDDVREVVKYAAARHITIVPEVEMPGHASAALAAYPQLSSAGGSFEPLMIAGIFHGIFDPSQEATFQLLNDVLTEVAQIFPGPYIHIGGDEVPKDSWKTNAACQALIKREGLKGEEELQSWFMHRIEKIVSANGKKMIGWSEILQGGLAKNAAVMDWIGGPKEATDTGHDVVMTPTAFCYFDFYQSSNRIAEPRAANWGGPLTLSKMYAFDPMPTNLPPHLQHLILGTQGNLWSEWLPSLKHAEYMIFPRGCALAEVAWSPQSSRDSGGLHAPVENSSATI